MSIALLVIALLFLGVVGIVVGNSLQDEGSELSKFFLIMALLCLPLICWLIAYSNCDWHIEKSMVLEAYLVDDVQVTAIHGLNDKVDLINLNERFHRVFEVGQKFNVDIQSPGPYMSLYSLDPSYEIKPIEHPQ